MEATTFAFAHAAVGFGLGVVLRTLILARNKGAFGLVHALLIAGSLSAIYFFADYVGRHVRSRTFSSEFDTISVAVLLVFFLAGYLLARRVSTGDTE